MRPCCPLLLLFLTLALTLAQQTFSRTTYTTYSSGDSTSTTPSMTSIPSIGLMTANVFNPSIATPTPLPINLIQSSLSSTQTSSQNKNSSAATFIPSPSFSISDSSKNNYPFISTLMPSQPYLNPSNDNAYGQITLDSSGTSLTQMYLPNCASYSNGTCIQCSFRFINNQGSCEPVNPLCATWATTGACLTCYAGYVVCESGCVMTDSCAPENSYDPNCRSTVNGVCRQCSSHFFFNRNGICTQVSPFCKTADTQGNCLSCYAGYGLTSTNCTLQPTFHDNNSYCQRWQNNTCQQCAANTWNNNTYCTPFDPMCARSSPNNGACLACYSGYFLTNNRCVINNNTSPMDLFCKRWNTAGVCTECSPRAFFRSNMCVASDPLCRTFDYQSGQCLSCYSGYNLTNGRCTLSLPISVNINQYCSLWQGPLCKKCSLNSFFNTAGICIPTNPFCSSYNNNLCISCYTGYTLQNNNCTLTTIDISVSDSLCARWNSNMCVQCAPRAYSLNGKCTAINTLCATWENTMGMCTSCYSGYLLQGGACILNNQAVNSNPLCQIFNGSVCLKCATRAYFANNGVCVGVSDTCNGYNIENGQCSSCYNGWVLRNGRCDLFQVSVPSLNPDIYCAKSGDSGGCVACFYGFVLRNGRCVQDFQNTPCASNSAFCRK